MEEKFCAYQAEVVKVFGAGAVTPYIHVGGCHQGDVHKIHGDVPGANLGQGTEAKVKEHKTDIRRSTNHRLVTADGNMKSGREEQVSN